MCVLFCFFFACVFFKSLSDPIAVVHPTTACDHSRRIRTLVPRMLIKDAEKDVGGEAR